MSSKNNNKLNIPEARAAMDKFKMEAANEVGVNLKEGYNGHLTSREEDDRVLREEPVTQAIRNPPGGGGPAAPSGGSCSAAIHPQQKEALRGLPLPIQAWRSFFCPRRRSFRTSASVSATG